MSFKTSTFQVSDGFENLHLQNLAKGHKVARWSEHPSNDIPTDCIIVENDYWIYRAEFGAIQFNETFGDVKIYPNSFIDPGWFQFWVYHSWLPMVYQVWGFQVLHSSAVINVSTGDVLAFAGNNEAGKSTIAFGLGQRYGWQQICDDTLSFTVDEGLIKLHYIPNVVRLRALSAKYYNQQTYGHHSIEWPDISMRLKHVYVLEGIDDSGVPGNIKNKKYIEAYHDLLENAYTLTLNIPKHNKRLMSNFLTLASNVRVYGLSTSINIEGVEEVLDAIENHNN